MTLDEAIKHCEEVAETKRQDAELAEISGCDNTSKQCETCAEEHRLLAEWLTELKMYREHFISAKMINDLAQFAITSTGQSDNYCLGMCNGIEYMRGVLTNTKCNFFEKTKGSEDKE